ncbi:hypothetical protein [Bacteroides faecis]|nr:hypothetical protein [Bacteroides faecis]KAA5271929.1 hypothetical protein F2Z41_01215 [Bacteroides faecis]RYT92817.1 hypothetical protein EAJ04_03300 [Bacteroides faecis]
MPKDTKTLGNNKARACESLGFVHKKRLCQRFDTTSFCLCKIDVNTPRFEANKEGISLNYL